MTAPSTSTVVALPGAVAPEEIPKFEFDESFQSKIAALTLRDGTFARRVDGLVHPEQFSNPSEGQLVRLALDYFGKYKRVPADKNVFAQVLKDARTKKLIRDSDLPNLVAAIKRLWEQDISDASFVVDQVADFARHQALEKAILESAERLPNRDFTAIQKLIGKAMTVGAAPEAGLYDFKAMIDARTANRKDVIAGKLPPQGITTGFPAIDKHLFHKGWGRKELSVLMGGAKAGKTLAMMDFGLAASEKGHNVLYVTLEVSADVLSSRADARISGQKFSELGDHVIDVLDKVRTWNSKAGAFHIMEYPSGRMRVSDLRRLLEHFKAQGIKLDLVIVDYADIMAPERHTDSTTENSKSVYVDLRGLAMEEGIAILTATQTNREGYKAAVAKAEHVAEDFNKVRIADVILSLNASEEEVKVGEARIFFAVCRNQRSGFSIRIKQDRERMKFIAGIVGEE